MKLRRSILLLAIASTCLPQLSAQPFRAAYVFGSGNAWSAAVELPAAQLINLGPDRAPLAVNDAGQVLLRSSDQQLILWTWGVEQVLLEGFTENHMAFLNEKGTVVATVPDENLLPEFRIWTGNGASVSLDWSDQLLAMPYAARLYALNDEDQLVLRTEASDNLDFLPPETIRIETYTVELPRGGWNRLSGYQSFNDIDFTLTQGGRLFEVGDINNYADAIGLVYEDQATSSAWDPEPVYSYQNQYFSINGDTALTFEPLQINDAGTILGRTPGPVYSMLVLDRFGERYLGPLLDDEWAPRLRMSNPANGFEEIVLGPHYWKRMTERNLDGEPTGNPAPDFWRAGLDEIATNSSGWENLEADCISASGRIAGTGWHYHAESGSYRSHAFLMAPLAMIPDWNRDGRIEPGEGNPAGRGRPWRVWINDDDDEGDLARSSQDDRPGSTEPDHANGVVDGLRDVVDWFPLHIDLQETLQSLPPGGSADIVLRHPDGAFGLVYTNLRPDEVGRLVTEQFSAGFGPALDRPLASAPVEAVTTEGVSLSPAFLAQLQLANRGVLLLEATAASTEPLTLELRVNGELVMTSSLPVSASPVADMFRLVNLRNCDTKFAGVDPGPWDSRTGDPPNLPDAELAAAPAGQHTLFHVHGYNWSGHESPAGHSEIFKRFHRSGSHARFIGVSWHGDEGTLDLTGSSFEYNENVINAFITAKYLAEALLPYAGSASSIFAHSLGNMVTSSAIFDHGLEVANFFMTNAAVPMEAYVGETPDRRLMVHPDWKDEGAEGVDYAAHLMSPDWHKLFPPDDKRSLLKWKDRFGDIHQAVRVINFYSSGEEVLRSGNGDLPSLFGDAADQELVWVFNEMVKGTNTFTANIAGEVHGGWGFNRHYMDWVDPGGAAHPPPGSWVPMPPAEAALLDPAGLIAEPFFHRFSSGDADFPLWGDGAWLYGDTASANERLPGHPFPGVPIDRIKNHAKVIAEAIPAHSAPAGSNPLHVLPLLDNIDMDTVFRDPASWPDRDDSEKRDRWLHGDYLYPALAHVSGFYTTCIELINTRS
jgi:hypothetical protein